jgi:hypothetical protein
MQDWFNLHSLPGTRFGSPDTGARPNRLASLVKPASLVHVRARSDWARLLALGIGIPLATASVASDRAVQNGLLLCYGCDRGFWWDLLCEAWRVDRGLEQLPVEIVARHGLNPSWIHALRIVREESSIRARSKGPPPVIVFNLVNGGNAASARFLSTDFWTTPNAIRRELGATVLLISAAGQQLDRSAAHLVDAELEFVSSAEGGFIHVLDAGGRRNDAPIPMERRKVKVGSLENGQPIFSTAIVEVNATPVDRVAIGPNAGGWVLLDGP